jgi:hypothetical protein
VGTDQTGIMQNLSMQTGLDNRSRLSRWHLRITDADLLYHSDRVKLRETQEALFASQAHSMV